MNRNPASVSYFSQSRLLKPAKGLDVKGEADAGVVWINQLYRLTQSET
jgi:hypothetical protein